MTWSPEELVKQLRYPSGYPAEFERQLMRDAADMIEQQLAARQEDYTASMALGSVRQDAIDMAAAIARIREVCANPPVPSRMLIPYILAALEGNQP